MALMQGDSLTGNNFGLQIDGVMVEYLAEVNGLTIEQDVIKHVQNNSATGKLETAVMPGNKKDGQCTVVRGMTQSASFTQWINDSINGRMASARKNASIILMDAEDTPVKRYNMRNAWCSKIDASSLKAGDTAALTETVTIVFEEMEVE
ncbi:phage tail protein [Streptomyces lancefieldiae]|uniref:Phage tail protein n=1 Tax=Streptomyces lancefieldiae TaxID=3075520 RepID=A0ABU3B1C7_9ACTN|nr:phage tail protein [Streptomyces sp. DSM 40712]MDT0616255.1 phage tail protein [Streptomyces sp. DSM 40712]